MDPVIRPGNDADGDGLIALIGACWSQYPGVRMDVDGEMPELRALASWYAAKGGALWTAAADGRIAGMIAVHPLEQIAIERNVRRRESALQNKDLGRFQADSQPENAPEAGAWEICRVYVHPSLHGSSLGHRLLDTAEGHAIAAGATRLVLWSDTRFDRAHAFYEKRSYVRAGAIRVLDDISHSLEFAYGKPVNGVEVLDAAGAASAERRLAAILVACVDAGASVSYLPPLAADVARGYWHRVATDVAAGKRILLAAWADGVLAGTAMLDLDTPPNQPHRAEVQTLLVHPYSRRKGLARPLMLRLETEARRAGRTLLTLDTRAGDHAEALYRALGWQEGGRIPGYALDSDGTPHDTLFLWKQLERDRRRRNRR